MKMFTAAETNEGLAALFRAEGAQMRSQLTSAVPSSHATPTKNNEESEFEEQATSSDLCKKQGVLPQWSRGMQLVPL